MKNLKYILILLLVLVVFYFFLANILHLFPQFSDIEKLIQKAPFALSIKKISEDISSPPPLRAIKEFPETFLMCSGIIAWTNIQRDNYGLSSLVENEQLSAAAALKAQDMFKKQYFSHISPSGVNTGNLITTAGYRFIAVGENLALGNFKDDKALVQEWMDSPGHRENILSSRYAEIGVAVAEGIFEGRSTWIAVQEFGLPLSSCPEINGLLKVQIEKNEVQLQIIEKELAAKRKELNSIRPKWGTKYNEKVNEYNALVAQYNDLSQATKALIDKYNKQIRAFNVCVVG